MRIRCCCILGSVMFLMMGLAVVYVFNFEGKEYSQYTISSYVRPACHLQTHYRQKKNYSVNNTFYVYAIQIGQMFVEHASQTLIRDINKRIVTDTLFNIHSNPNSTRPAGRQRGIYNQWFGAFDRANCLNNKQFIDFFKFIQLDHDDLLTNDPNMTDVHYYGLKQIVNTEQAPDVLMRETYSSRSCIDS